MPDRPPADEIVPTPEAPTGTPAETYPFQQHSWTLQQPRQITGDLGKVQEAVNTLKDTVKEQGKSLDAVKRTVYLATGGFLVAAVIVGWTVKVVGDNVVEALSKLN